MAEFLWRSKCRIVAFFDFIFTCIALVVFILRVLVITGATPVQIDHNSKHIVEVVIFGIIICVRFWLVLNLTKATEKSLETFKALEYCRVWRNFNVILLLVSSLINFFLLGLIWFASVMLVARLLFLCTVQQFIKELEAETLGRGYIDRHPQQVP